MNNIIKSAGRAIGYLGGGLTIISFVQGIQTNKQNKAIIDILSKRVQIQNEIISNYETQIKKEGDYVNLSSKVIDINEDTAKALNESKKLSDLSKQLENSNLDNSQVEILKKDFSYHTSNLENFLNSSNMKLEELNRKLNEIFGSSSKNNFIAEDFIRNYQDYLSNLPLEKVGALGHILLCIAMLFSLFTIGAIFYGDSLIKYYKLEEKFPKLARFIQLRRKFQFYYFTVNISLIIITLLLIIYVNFIVFLN